MVEAKHKFMQPDDDTPFGRHLKEVTRYLNIGLPSFTGTYNATLPEEERWLIQAQVPGRTFAPVTPLIAFSFNAPTWSLGRSMAAHIAMGRIGEVYKQELKDTIYQICGRWDENWDMISTRKDRSIAAFIQELNHHIRRQEHQMCAGMIDLKKALNRNLELEEELKSTRDGYEEEMKILVDKNDDLTRKLGILMGEEDEEEEPKEIPPEDYIIIDDTDLEAEDSKDEDYEDEAWADIMESSADQYF